MFRDVVGNEVTLKRAANLPGYEIKLSTSVVIESAVNNPFFKGVNILQLPKKIKGFRDNSDLNDLLAPKILETGIFLSIADDECAFFVAERSLVSNRKLMNVKEIFGNKEQINPMFINFGLKNIKLSAGTVIGTVVIIKTNLKF
ncbi:hypothetical protein FKV75_01035 [Weissella paramesenteroides]|uniref:hypothetical protein n=1 Tax=Weissella paramesenteroides TaxID=1249 RepID=UPI001238D84C|nr:hypothetical protein [Weissella paramesenteroides]KAA8442508.1 hypothetical protein FKV77_04640 [Weissella paramesenteroides]KAA8442855.1 hypothetical protein FKV81_00630 [Weissella paramesenteroides]KAA8444470.1 hypothetical protein FKV75_01035 [Weissella paramesenteroides]KAA8448137.1 hypothetical protein FKV76_02600 [Weissella paramesenteroides]KAA8452051.1 hypothetical protein FKV74_00630 [Weissella paramesenteroides]